MNRDALHALVQQLAPLATAARGGRRHLPGRIRSMSDEHLAQVARAARELEDAIAVDTVSRGLEQMAAGVTA